MFGIDLQLLPRMAMTRPTLLVLAAGMGSRYGGLKQLDAMGPSGQTMLDYAVLDAIRAGFGKIVFVIRRNFEDAFREHIGGRFDVDINIAYAFQSLDDLPGGFTVPEGRTKPWGTAHAVRAARGVVREPFAVINADDFYGRQAYEIMGKYLHGHEGDHLALSTVGYHLDKTLSAHGSVNRGVCQIADGKLVGVEEYTGICEDADGVLRGDALNGERLPLAHNSVVSLNFWGFTPAIFESIESYFIDFLKRRGAEQKSECYIPSVVDHLIKTGQAECPVLETHSPWFGVTYPEDKPRVVASIQALTEAGEYPA